RGVSLTTTGRPARERCRARNTRPRRPRPSSATSSRSPSASPAAGKSGPGSASRVSCSSSSRRSRPAHCGQRPSTSPDPPAWPPGDLRERQAAAAQAEDVVVLRRAVGQELLPQGGRLGALAGARLAAGRLGGEQGQGLLAAGLGEGLAGAVVEAVLDGAGQE